MGLELERHPDEEPDANEKGEEEKEWREQQHSLQERTRRKKIYTDHR